MIINARRKSKNFRRTLSHIDYTLVLRLSIFSFIQLVTLVWVVLFLGFVVRQPNTLTRISGVLSLSAVAQHDEQLEVFHTVESLSKLLPRNVNIPWPFVDGIFTFLVFGPSQVSRSGWKLHAGTFFINGKLLPRLFYISGGYYLTDPLKWLPKPMKKIHKTITVPVETTNSPSLRFIRVFISRRY